MQNVYPFIYAIIITLVFAYYYHKNKCFNGGTYLLSIWMVSACIGAIYEINPIWEHNNPITLLPYIYLLVIHYFVFRPLLKFKTQNIQNISCDFKTIKRLLVFIIFINLLPFTENIYQTLKGISQGSAFDIEAFNERYENSETTLYYMSSLSRKLVQIANAFRLVLIAGTFYYFAIDKKKRSPFISLGIILCYLNIISHSLNTGSRATIIMYALIAVYIFLLFKPLYAKSIRRKIYKTTFLIGTLIIIVFFTISFSRFSDIKDDTRVERTFGLWLMSYMGESHGNFNGDVWGLEKFNGWDPFTYQIATLFGHAPKEIKNNFSEYQSWKEGQFQTYVGTYYRSYGPIIAFIVLISLGILFSALIQNKRVLRFSDLLLISFYAKIPILGFTYFAYLFDRWQIIIMPLLIIIFKIKEKSRQ